ncbi:MAG: ferrochelatase [Pseudomonadota bacterium]
MDSSVSSPLAQREAADAPAQEVATGRIAVVLFNLGGPDSLEAVQPFLYNLFADPAIIRLPRPFRLFLARLISKRRAPIAREIYAQMGGRSPIVPNTDAQAEALRESLGDLGTIGVFPVMRYWHPRADAVAEDVAAFNPDSLILLPLYPQFSTTTSGSSIEEWQREAKRVGLKNCPTHTVCCYPTERGFVAELAGLIKPRLEEAAKHGKPRLLLSAHGLPEKIVKDGDPYQRQVEMTAEATREALGIEDLDLVVCYQSRVGPMKWIGPATIDEVQRAGADGCPLVLAPVAFVSEHSETLVELDIELAEVAEEAGVPSYHRVPTVDAGAAFIEGLSQLVRAAMKQPPGVASLTGGRLCSPDRRGCPCRP